ncbi:hypothetical protein B0H12DRAFT_1079207 [Mycena haematopus]|nr:hypothetical protein B0H12DRAFT_1079207 [Mycena haematopus]
MSLPTESNPSPPVLFAAEVRRPPPPTHNNVSPHSDGGMGPDVLGHTHQNGGRIGGTDATEWTIHQFCRQYRLSDKIRNLLDEEGFETVEDLLYVSGDDLKKAGFKLGQIAGLKRALEQMSKVTGHRFSLLDRTEGFKVGATEPQAEIDQSMGGRVFMDISQNDHCTLHRPPQGTGGPLAEIDPSMGRVFIGSGYHTIRTGRSQDAAPWWNGNGL